MISASRAPQAAEGLLLWWTGYLANVAELQHRLGQTGPEARDPLTLLARAYRIWGSRLSAHVDGEFALAIYDPASGTACVTHDELGLRPLFYRADGDRLEFGSHLCRLTDRIGPQPIDEDYVADYLATGEHAGSCTPFAGISRLAPGHAFEWAPAGSRLVDCRTLLEEGDRIEDDEDVIDERFRALASAAVAAATVGEDSLLCELSGGLDSSSVFSLANGQACGSVQSVSTVYPRSTSADESAWIAEALAFSPAPWLTIDADEHGHYTCLPFGRPAEPSLLSVKAAWQRAYRALLERYDIRTVVTGEGGDAVLYGDSPQPLFMADQLLGGRWVRLWRTAARWGADERGERSRLYALCRYAIGPAWRHWRGEQLHQLEELVPWLATDYASSIAADERRRQRAFRKSATSIARSSRLEQIAVSARNASLFYHQIDESVGFRHPLMNRALIRFMLSLPDTHRFAPRRDRIVQRRALAGIVAPAVLARRNKGGGSEPWIRGLEQGDVWPDLLTRDSLLVRRGYFDRARWQATVDQARVGRFVALKYFDAASSMEAWLRADEKWRASRTSIPNWPIVLTMEGASSRS